MGDATGPPETPLEIEARYHSGAVSRRPVTIVRAEGVHLIADDGTRYLDCAAGHGWANLGHAHPQVTDAIRRQAGTLVCHTESSANDERALWFRDLAAAVEAAIPPTERGKLARIMPANSGTEAMEGAIKFARYTTGRTAFVACHGGFHGRTLGALSATAASAYRERFEPLVPGFTHVRFNDVAAADEAIGDETAGVIVEVVQGEGGVRPAEPEFLGALARYCRDRGALLIVDEIQTGLGRTGRWFACEWHDTCPDILVLGKALGGGIPMGAAIWRTELGAFEPGQHGSTFAGNPLACAASRAVLSVLRDERLPARAERVGATLMAKLCSIPSPQIREVRGRGLMIGIELKSRVTPVLKRLMDRGVWALPAGPSVLRLLPPLVIDDEALDTLPAIIEEAIDAG